MNQISVSGILLAIFLLFQLPIFAQSREERIKKEMDSLASALPPRYNVQGVQMALFFKGSTFLSSSGLTPDGPLTNDSLLRAPDFLRPAVVISLLACEKEKNGLSPQSGIENLLPGYRNPFSQKNVLTLSFLLSDLSGIPAFASASAQRFESIVPPGTLLIESPYARGAAVDLLGSCSGESLSESLARYSSFSLLSSSGDSFRVSARGYLEFIKTLGKKKEIQGPIFAYDPALGGSGPGLSYLNAGGGRYILQVLDAGTGHSGLAAAFPDGSSIVIISAGASPHLMRHIFRNIVKIMYDSDPAYASSHLLAAFGYPEEGRPLPDAAQFKDLEGFYRPLHALPEDREFLAFLSDMQLSVSDSEGIELSSLIQKKAAVRLIPLGDDLFVASGIVPMDGWHAKVRREAGEVTGIDMDLARYIKVSPILSGRGIIVLLGLGVSLPFFILLAIVLRRKKKRLNIL